MNKTSIVIPAREEPYLTFTIMDALDKADGDVEVIPVLDDYYPIDMVDDKRVRYVRHKMHGKRHSMNLGAQAAKGVYLLFLDAHCCLAQGYDQTLKANCGDNWVVIPRRYDLNVDTWDKNPDSDKYPVDYMYVCYPPKNPNKFALDGFRWRKRQEQRKDYLVDETMVGQGSGMFMPAAHYRRLGGLDPNGGGNLQDSNELCLKTWLSGGKVIVNKQTWYAHWRKTHDFWEKDKDDIAKGVAYTTDLFMENKWQDRTHDLEWLIDKFAPVPTWPGNWRERWQTEKNNNGHQA